MLLPGILAVLVVADYSVNDGFLFSSSFASSFCHFIALALIGWAGFSLSWFHFALRWLIFMLHRSIYIVADGVYFEMIDRT